MPGLILSPSSPATFTPNQQEVFRPLVLFLTPFSFYFAYYIRTDARAISSCRSALPEHEAAAGKAGVLKIQNIRRNPFWKNRLNRTEIYLNQQSRRKTNIWLQRHCCQKQNITGRIWSRT